MKRALLLILLSAFALALNAQELITHKKQFKKGIYKTFEEFKYDNPSLPLVYPIEEKKRIVGGLLSGKTMSKYKLDIKRNEAEEIGTVFGFCDGANVYINPDVVLLTPATSFFKIVNFGRYCHFEAESFNYGLYGNYGLVQNQFNNLNQLNVGSPIRSYGNTRQVWDRFIDIKDGTVLELTTKNVAKYLEEDDALSEEYEKERKKKKRFKEYLLNFNARNAYKE